MPDGDLNLLELAFYALKARHSGPYHILQIGAFDGMHRDPLTRILDDPDVRALLLEPQTEPFETLKGRFPADDRVILENKAVGLRTGPGKLYLPNGAGAVPTASLRASHLKNFSEYRPREIEVEMITPFDLFSKHDWWEMDVLQIDAEGMDFDIVMNVFDLKVYPKIINIESFHMNSENRQAYYGVLSRLGYRFIDWQFDTLAVRELRDSPEAAGAASLASRPASPPFAR